MAGGSAPGGNFWGNDFRNAYCPGINLSGAGQTVGLLCWDNYFPSDISTYISQTGIAANASAVTNLYFDGAGPNVVPNDGGEISLDIEDTLAMAPGISQLRVYMGLNVGSADDLVNAMASDNLAKTISASFLWAPVDTTAQQAFMEMIAQGQSFYAASGDSGAWDPSLRRRGSELRERVAHGTILRHGRGGHRWNC